MTPDKPTAAEMAVSAHNLMTVPANDRFGRIAAKRALFAEQAARELLAALHRCAGGIGHDAIEARALMARYEDIYGEQPK